jgi:hypothetical protein
MRRWLSLAALAVLLVSAAPAAAWLPSVRGSAVGDGVPLKAYASITPPVHLFADAITARVAVVADTKWVDPRRLRVRADFAPYEPMHGASVLRSGSGRFLQVTWTWTLRCLSAACVPHAPPSDEARIFRFPPAQIDYFGVEPKRHYGITAAFPAVKVVSQLSPGVIAYLVNHKALHWQAPLTPVAAPTYRLSPALVFWVALALAGLAAAAGLLVAARWALSFRSAAPADAPAPPASTLERALAVFFWARERGDETLQRKALERVANELPPEVRELAETAHALAWSPDAPEDEDVQAISERAGARPEGEA